MTAAVARAQPAVSGWADLIGELDAWGAAGRAATFWWRDDDAIAPTSALDRLLEIAAAAGAAPALAVIPAGTSQALADRLAGAAGQGAALAVLQHGYAHIDHGTAKKSELGPERALALRLDELQRGAARMAALFGPLVLPVLAPPWNRIGADLAAALPGIGIAGLSCYNARPARLAAPGLVQANTHVDIVDWHANKRFLGAAGALALATGHLAARRLGRADRDEPTGLLTHHLVHGAAAWRFVGDFIVRTRAHPAARWLAPAQVFEAVP
jgi:hypothetical protein